MKRFGFIMLALVLMAVLSGPAMAGERIYVDNQAAASAVKGAGIPASGGKYAVITAFSLDGAAATADAIFLVYDDEQTTLSAAEASGQTALSLTECGTLTDDVFLFIQEDANEPIYDVTQMSACNDTTNVATVTATDKAFSAGSYVFEMTEGGQWADLGTTIINVSSADGIFMGNQKGTPVGIIFNGSGGSVLWVSGTHRK